MNKIGVFICHCSLSPLSPVVSKEVAGSIGSHPGVVYAAIHQEMCLDPGLEQITRVVEQNHLDAVVLTTCSPSIHSSTFRQSMTSADLGTHQVEIVDLKAKGTRNTTGDIESSAEGLIDLINASVDKLRRSDFSRTTESTITKRALVIGGGVAGLQSALDIAEGGYEVVVVEKTPSIGGHMLQYSEVFPTLDCPQCIMTPKMVEVSQHPAITLLTYAEVQQVRGVPGNFEVDILQKARKVDHHRCTGCGTCWQKCPEKVPSEFDVGVTTRTAIYIPFPQAVPSKPVIDTEHCRYTRYLRFLEEKGEGKKPPQCRICEKLCPTEAIDWDQPPEILTEKFGAIVLATGFELMPLEQVPEYSEDPDVINGIQFERILAPGGPSSGVVFRPSDGKTPREVAFISCVGSRDPELGVPYCSRVCCMYLAKQAMLYKHAVPDGQAYIFYIDTRSTGKGYEEFIQRAIEEGVLYIRGKVSRVFRDGEKLIIWGVDTLSGHRVEVACDLVVLGMAIVPPPGIKDLAEKLGIITDEAGFITESHAKLRPMETLVPGIYVAGTAQGPKDIPDSVAQASGAAAKVLTLFSKNQILVEEPAVG
jgi:heterodisulfide reductase subunit A